MVGEHRDGTPLGKHCANTDRVESDDIERVDRLMVDRHFDGKGVNIDVVDYAYDK